MAAEKSGKKVCIKWIKSISGAKEPHRRTIKALGLRKLQGQVVKQASPEILGMANLVRHLVQVTEVE